MKYSSPDCLRSAGTAGRTEKGSEMLPDGAILGKTGKLDKLGQPEGCD